MKRSELIIKLIEHGFTQEIQHGLFCNKLPLRTVWYRKSTPCGGLIQIQLRTRRNRYNCVFREPDDDPENTTGFVTVREADVKRDEFRGSTANMVDRFVQENGGYT